MFKDYPIQKDESINPEEDARPVGRPKGSKDKTKRKSRKRVPKMPDIFGGDDDERNHTDS